MTQTKKQRGERLRTPMGTAIFPHLSKPDTKFASADKPYGHFRTGLALPAGDPATQKFVADLERRKAEFIAKESQRIGKTIKKIADSPWKEEEDEDGNPTGNIVFNFKAPGGGRREDGSEWVGGVDIFDSKGTKLDPSKLRVGGGSEIVVVFEPRGFYVPALGAGLSLRLQAVQIRKLVEFSGRDAKAYGFEVADDTDGYVFEQGAAMADAGTEVEAGATEDNDI